MHVSSVFRTARSAISSSVRSIFTRGGRAATTLTRNANDHSGQVAPNAPPPANGARQTGIGAAAGRPSIFVAPQPHPQPKKPQAPLPPIQAAVRDLNIGPAKPKRQAPTPPVTGAGAANYEAQGAKPKRQAPTPPVTGASATNYEAQGAKPKRPAPTPPVTGAGAANYEAQGARPKRQAPTPPVTGAGAANYEAQGAKPKRPAPSPPMNSKKLYMRCGTRIGNGKFGVVYQDRLSPNHVIKRLTLDGDPLVREAEIQRAKAECWAFNAYYGESSAKFVHGTGGVYVHMVKVPGIRSDLLSQQDFRRNMGAYHDMLSRVHDAGFVHADMHRQNILYDEKRGRFNPIDMTPATTSEQVMAINMHLDETVNVHNATKFYLEVDYSPTASAPAGAESLLAPPIASRLHWETKL